MDDEDRRKYDLYGKNCAGRRSTPYTHTGLDDLYARYCNKSNEYTSKNTSNYDYSYDGEKFPFGYFLHHMWV